MPWQELKLDAPASEADTLAEVLEELGAAAITLQDAADQPLFEPAPGATPLWDRTRITALFDAEVDVPAVVAGLAGTPLGDWRVEPLREQDWERVWMERFVPLRFGRRLWVCPSWHEPPEPEAVNLLLDPGLAFGTGTHATTGMCLEWLDARLQPNRHCVDFGCGSGILGVAACLLGAASVWAVDIDPQALQATRANAERNDVAECIHTSRPEAMPTVQVEVVLANILAGPLIELAPRIAALAAPGGAIVLSGILCEQAEAVIAAYAPWAELRPWREREGWVCLEGIRRAQ